MNPKCAAGGTVLDVWGSVGSAVPLCLVWNPLQPATLAVGQQNGSVDILRSKSRQTQQDDPRSARHATTSLHHLAGHAVRTLAYTPDGCLLVAGNDAGAIAVWDVELSPTSNMGGGLVHHITNAHKHWICNIQCIDNQRFISIGTDKQIHVWQFRELYRPVHTFHLDHSVWSSHVLMDSQGQSSISVKKNPPKLITGSDTGWIQIFSLE
jgi:WD40 repeat protein